MSAADRFNERVEFFNEWLPWQEANAASGGQRTLLVEAKGRRKAGVMLHVRPWLAYGCSIGARLKVQSAYFTVTAICEDERCEVVRDGVRADQQANLTERVDPTPDTVSRTSSFSYKSGQRLMLLHNGCFIDAMVVMWLGLRRGSRHSVRTAVASERAAVGTNGAPLVQNRRLSTSGANSTDGLLEVDLNDLNHAKLLFPSVAKYEAALAAHFESLATRHATVRDASTDLRLPSVDQRVFLKPGVISPTASGDNPSEIDPKIREVFQQLDSDDSGGIDAKELRQALSLLGLNAKLKDAQTIMKKYDADHSKALGLNEFARLVGDLRGTLGKDLSAVGAPQMSDAAEQHDPYPSHHETDTASVNALTLIEGLLAPMTDVSMAAGPTFIRVKSENERDLLQSQLLHVLACTAMLSSTSNPRRQVPAVLSLTRLVEMNQDETRRTSPREMAISVMALDHPSTALPDMLRQAMELHALVVVANVRRNAHASAVHP